MRDLFVLQKWVLASPGRSFGAGRGDGGCYRFGIRRGERVGGYECFGGSECRHRRTCRCARYQRTKIRCTVCHDSAITVSDNGVDMRYANDYHIGGVMGEATDLKI